MEALKSTEHSIIVFRYLSTMDGDGAHRIKLETSPFLNRIITCDEKRMLYTILAND